MKEVQNQMIVSNDAEKNISQVQHPFMKNTLKKLC